MQLKQGRCICLMIAVVFLGLSVAAWYGWRWLCQGEGNTAEVFSLLQVGMSQEDALQILQTFEASSCQSCHGATADGRAFSTLHLPSVNDLPPPEEIDYCILQAEDYHGREIEVTLGQGGIVSSKRLSPGVWTIRWKKVYRAFRDKPYRALLIKYRYIATGLAFVLLSTFAVVSRHWMVKSRPRCPECRV
jgi:hypothetical protein